MSEAELIGVRLMHCLVKSRIRLQSEPPAGADKLYRQSGFTGRLGLVAGILLGLITPAGVAQNQDQAPADNHPERAGVPLEDIVGAAESAEVTVAALDDLPQLAEALEKAWAGLEDGRLLDTVKILEEALKQPGGQRREVYYLLARAKTHLGQFEGVRELAEQAARYGPADADTHYLLGQIYQHAGEKTLAIAHYRSTTLAAQRELNNPNVTRSWYSLGILLKQEGYLLAAAQAFASFDRTLWQTHVEQRNAPDVTVMLAGYPHGMVPERIKLLLGLKRFEDALATARWAREIWPDAPAISTLYAKVLQAAGQFDQAFDFCRERLIDPKMSEALLPTAIETAQAAKRLTTWLNELTEQAQSGRGLALARQVALRLVAAGDSDAALPLANALLSKLPDDEQLVWAVAAARRDRGDLSGGLEALLEFVRHDPDAARISPQQLAICKTWFAGGAGLSELVREFHARPETDFATDYILGACALAAEDLSLANELLQACLSVKPDYTPAILVRGEMLLSDYRWESARKYADELLANDPKLAAAHYLLARVHAGLDENDAAEQAYKLALKYAPDESAYKLELARYYRRLGNLRGAQRYYQETLTAVPGNGEALEGLIESYLRSGKIEIAQRCLEQIDRDRFPADALRRVDTLMRFLSDPFGAAHLAELRSQWERFPDDIDTARLLAGGLYFRGRYEEARTVIDQALAQQPDDYHLTILLANVQSIRGNFEAAIGLLKSLAQRYPNRLAVLQPLALADMNDFRLEPGREILQRLMELDPEQVESYRVQLLRSYVEFSECEQADELVERWIKAEPDNDTLIHHKIAVLLDCQRNDAAFEIVKQRLDEDPSDQRRLEFLEYGQQSAHYSQVAEHLRDWLEKNPSNATLCQYLIDVLLQMDKPDEALAVATKFEGTYSESFRRRIWMGRCRAALGELDQALAEFDALLDERGAGDEEKRAARWQIVAVLHDAGQIDQALQRCDQWISDSDRARNMEYEALFNKRWLLQSAGRDEECAKVMEKLLESRPNDVGIFNDLGYTWIDLGINLERATEMIKAAVAAEPWNAAYLDSLGWAYYKADDFAFARKYLDRAVRLRGGRDPVLYDHLADAAYRQGDLETARLYWKKALTLLETDSPEQAQKPTSKLLANLRGKLEALDRATTPDVAPTAMEQNKD